MNRALWIVQSLLALLFIFAGVMKFVMPIQQMTQQMPLSATFIHFIGVSEILGGIGLILPWWLKIQPWLTPLAAALLTIIMIGAVAITVKIQPIQSAILPFVTGLLCIFVAWGRRRTV